jgi:excisionase family DNA binding protein
MLVPEMLQLAKETAQDLHAQGHEERAQAVEAVLEVATSALTGKHLSQPPEYFTVGQLSRALGLPSSFIAQCIRAGELRAIHVGSHILVHRGDLHGYYQRLQEAQAHEPQRPPPTPEELAAKQREHNLLAAALPADKVRRLETLHDKLEDEERLTRGERRELVALEHEITDAAARVLRERIGQAKVTQSYPVT